MASWVYREQRADQTFALKPRLSMGRPDWRRLKPDLNNVWAAIIYLVVPSLVVSLIYRSPRLVIDSVLLMALEAIVPPIARRFLRLVWIVVCGCVLLMEWNIYSESYLFYSSMLARILFTPHGFGILCALLFTAGFLALPVKLMKPNLPFLVVCLVVYVGAVALKGPVWGEQKPVWLRVPFGRAVQAMISERDRFFDWSVTGKGPAQVEVTHHLYDVVDRTPPAQLPSKMMVFMMESWGEREADLDVIRKRVQAVPGVKVVEAGYDAYRGSTLPGEVRELCGMALDFKHPGSLSGNCLPRRFKDLGYQTTAFHGFDGFFYSRDVIYPALGFDKVNFRQQLKTVPICGGAFPGRCDDETSARVLATAARPGRQFTYMMTLSAHAIVDPATLNRPYAVENRIEGMEGSPGQLLNRALVLKVVSQAAADPALRGAMLYFSGDHNPAEEAEWLRLPQGRTPYLLVKLD